MPARPPESRAYVKFGDWEDIVEVRCRREPWCRVRSESLKS